MTTIDTSTNAVATGHGNLRKLGQTANGNLWAWFQRDTQNVEFWYSDDDGATWTQDATTIVSTTSTMEFVDARIDESDYLHVVYDDGVIRYRRGTPNLERTAWTLSAATSALPLSGASARDAAICVHAEGTGWVAHVLYFDQTTGSTVRHVPITIDAGGTITVGSMTQVAADAGIGRHTLSIDFHHTGDGKTVQGSAPHLFASWSQETDGIRFAKATYSAGSWTWGTVRSIDATRDAHLTTEDQTWLVGWFDGTRYCIAGLLYDGANYDLMLYERNVGDTNTTTRELLSNTSTSDRMAYGTATYDEFQNIFLFGANQNEAAGSKDLVYRKWTRSTATLGAEVGIDSAVGDPYVAAKPSSSGFWVDFVYTDGTGSPFNVVHGNININAAPTAPLWVTADNQAADVAANLVLDWTFQDPNTGDTPSAYALKRDIGGTVRWWDGTDWDAVAETFVTTTDTTVSLASWGADGDATHLYYVAQKDAAGEQGPYSTALSVIPDAKVNPVVTAPTGTITAATTTATWTSTDQSEFKVDLLDAAGTTLLWTSGWVVDSALRSWPILFVLANTTTYTVRVTTKTAEGLTSNPDTETFDTDFTVPDPAVLTVTTNSPTGAITVEWENPTSGETATSVDLFVRVAVGSIGDGNRTTTARRILAAGEPDSSYVDWAVGSGVDYEYMVRSWADNGTFTDSDWTSAFIDGGDIDVEDAFDFIDGGVL